MNSKEIIKRVIDFNSPPRIGLDFIGENISDIAWILSGRLINEKYQNKMKWGHYEELKDFPGFKGEINFDTWGNIYGRLNEKTKGECIRGALEDNWDKLDSYNMPIYDEAYDEEVKRIVQDNKDKYLVGAFDLGVFSTIRDLRKMDNILMDLILEEDNVVKLLNKIEVLAVTIVEKASKNGFDAIIIYDDWGTQDRLLINPILWRKIFKKIYKNIADEIHKKGMKFILHSCGYIYEIIEDLIEVGVDVFQFDQPDLIGVKKLADEFGGRVTFWCPVDIQSIMRTGNKEIIQKEAINMVESFKRFSGGFIAKDYPSWDDIDIKDEWAQWARDLFIENSVL